MKYSTFVLSFQSCTDKLKRFLKGNRKQHTHISPEEYEAALFTVLRMVQAESFPEEISQLQNEKHLARSRFVN